MAKHGNVDFISRMEKEVSIVSEDDDFPNATLMSIDVINQPEEYRDIIIYLQGMTFSEDATKQIRTRIEHKSQFYILIDQLLYFSRRDGVLRRAIGKAEIPRLLWEFHERFCGEHFADRITVEKILMAGYYWSTMFKDSFDYCKRCEIYQAFANRSTVSGVLHPIPPLGPFENWSIDLM